MNKINGAEFKYNHLLCAWTFFYGDIEVMSIDDCHVKDLRIMMGDYVSDMEAFKMLVGEWILFCITESEYNPDLHLLLTKMSECDRI